jgi:hypothetical protein
MRTKNILSIAALIICGLVCVNSVKAQTQTSDNVTVNIKFKPIQSIVVNPAADHQTVDLVYATKNDYANGVTAKRNNHLEIFSTGGFIVTANTDGDFTRTADRFISAADVKVIATNGAGTNNGKFTEVALSTTPKTLITATKGGRALKYNVTYDNTAGASDAYINKYKKADGTESVYTATVIYTIAAK